MRATVGLLCVLIAATTWCQAIRPKRELPYVPPKRWALLIGAERYTSFTPLNYASDDAKALAQTLIEDFRFEPANVRTLSDEPGDEPPTVANIRKQLDETLKGRQLDRGDLFVFYFSGHGAAGSTGDFLLPTDSGPNDFESTGLAVKQIIQAFVDSGLKNVLIICDACRTGKENQFGNELQALGKKSNIAVLLGCAPGTPSYEYSKFGHGIFTHFLLKTLKAHEPKEPSTGALWASAVAKQVQTQVAAQTEKDFSKAGTTSAPANPIPKREYVQMPAIWSEPTQDVLLGAFVPDAFGKENLKAFEERAAKLNQRNYGSSLATFADSLYEQDRFAEAIQLYKTLDGIGEMTSAARYGYAMALNWSGRPVEASKVFETLAKDKDPYFSKLAVASNPSRTVPPAQRIAAAKGLWELAPSASSGLLAFAVLQNCARDADKATFARTVLATLGPTNGLTAQERGYYEGVAFMYEGKPKEAISAFESAVRDPGPLDYTCRLLMLPVLRQDGNMEGLQKVMEGGRRDSKHAGMWNLLLAAHLKERGDTTGASDAIREALKHDLEADELLLLLRFGGMDSFRWADEIIAACDKHPFAWEALMVRAFARGAQEAKSDPVKRQQIINDGLMDAMKYADDEVKAYAAMLDLLDPLLTELHQKKAIPETQYAMLYLGYSAYLAGYVPQFGNDPDLWYSLFFYGLRSEREAQVLRLMKAYLGDRISDGTLEPALRSQVLMVAVNAGDIELAMKIYKAGDFDPYDQNDAGWILAVGLIGFDRDKEASELIATLPKPSPDFAELERTLRAFSLAVQQKGAEAKMLLSGLKLDDPGIKALAGIVYSKLGESGKAEPLLLPGDWSWRYFPLTARATRIAYAAALQKGDPSEVLAIGESLQGHPGNPMLRDLAHTSTRDVKGYAGTIGLKGVLFDDQMNQERVELKLTLSETGKITGTIGGFVVDGSIDSFGNLIGKAVKGTEVLELESKIAPASHYGSSATVQPSGLLVMLYSKMGSRIMGSFSAQVKQKA